MSNSVEGQHRPIYRRIEIGPRPHVPPAVIEAIPPYVSAEEQERIWAITRHTAEGCSAPTINQSEYLAPSEDCA